VPPRSEREQTEAPLNPMNRPLQVGPNSVPRQSEKPLATLARIAQLDPNGKSVWQPDFWTDLEPSSPPLEQYKKNLAKRLQQIGCSVEGAPYVIRGLRENSYGQGFYARLDSAQAAALAKTFLDEQHCPGANGLSEQDKAALQKIAINAVAATDLQETGAPNVTALSSRPKSRQHQRPAFHPSLGHAQ
jgi:hypothetical protein